MLRPSIHINPARGQVSATPQFQTHQAAHRGGPAWPQARRGPPQRRPQPHGHPDPATDPKCPRSLAPCLESVGPGQTQHRGAPVPGVSGMCPHARSPANLTRTSRGCPRPTIVLDRRRAASGLCSVEKAQLCYSRFLPRTNPTMSGPWPRPGWGHRVCGKNGAGQWPTGPREPRQGASS